MSALTRLFGLHLLTFPPGARPKRAQRFQRYLNVLVLRWVGLHLVQICDLEDGHRLGWTLVNQPLRGPISHEHNRRINMLPGDSTRCERVYVQTPQDGVYVRSDRALAELDKIERAMPGGGA